MARKPKREEWTCPRCGLWGDHMQTMDPNRCVQCCRQDAADEMFYALGDLCAAAAKDGMLCVNLIEFARRLHVGREALRTASGVRT